MQSRPTLLQRRLIEDPKRIQGYSTGARSESGFVHRRHHGHSTTRTFSRYGSYTESYGMAAGTPAGRRYLAEPKEVAGPASNWSWARTTDGRAASGNGYYRAHGGPTGDEGWGSTIWNRTVPARFLTGGG